MSRPSKAGAIKRMAETTADRALIAEQIGVSKAYVTQVLSGRQDSFKVGHETHNVFTPYKRKQAQYGSCVRTVLVDGQPQICGQPCKKQYCHEHADTTRPIAVRWLTKAGRQA